MKAHQNSSKSNKKQKEKDNLFMKYPNGIESPFFEAQIANEITLEEINDKKEVEIINNSHNNNNKDLFKNDSNLFQNDKKSLFGNNTSLFGDNKNNLFDNSKPLFENSKSLFGDNKNSLFDNNKTLFGDNKNSLFDNNNKPLFENSNTIFGDNKNSLFDNNIKTLFGNNEKIFGNDNINLSDNNKKSLFENNKSLFGDNQNSLFNNPLFQNNKNLLIDNTNILSNKHKAFEEDNNCKEKDEKNEYKNNNNEKSEENNENDEEDDSENDMNEECEENNDDENEEEGNNILASIFRGLKGKEKWYCKKKNVPKPTYQLAKNVLAKNIGEKVNSEIVSILHFKETFMSAFDSNYIDVKELKNGNFFILFDNIFYCINSKTFKIINNDESLQKYFSKKYPFSYFEQINNELIGIISSDFLLIVKFDNKEVKFFQEITIKASIFKSFPSENLIIITEYAHEKEKRLNILNYYTYDDKNLKYQLKAKEDIDFTNFGKDIIDYCDLFNCIGNIKKLKNGKIILFTISSIPLEEKQNFDELNRSFYERDCQIFLNIYFYENKELSTIFQRNYIQHYVYDNDIFESDYGNILNFWNDRNIKINEENKIINFFIPSLYRYMEVNYETKKRNRMKFQIQGFMNYFFDKKLGLFYLIKENNLDMQVITLYDLNMPIKNIYLPYYFSHIFPTKKGYLLGVVKNTLTVYSFYHHLGRYAPSQIIQTSLCLLKFSI